MTDVPKKLMEVDEGGSAILICRASGTKPNVVTWSFKGDSSSMPLYSNVGYDGSLFLRKISIRSQGKYTCIVKNAAGSVEYETRVVVSKCPSWYFSRNFFKINTISTTGNSILLFKSLVPWTKFSRRIKNSTFFKYAKLIISEGVLKIAIP